MSVPPGLMKAAATAAMLIEAISECNNPSVAFNDVLRNVVVHYPEDRWAEIMKSVSQPCNYPGCQCEKERQVLLAALDTLRRAELAKRLEQVDADKEGGFAA